MKKNVYRFFGEKSRPKYRQKLNIFYRFWFDASVGKDSDNFDGSIFTIPSRPKILKHRNIRISAKIET